jgi:TRAP-type C4-dicarboxylate transport system permease small subunit
MKNVDNYTGIPDSRTIAALWAGLLVPPLAFLANLEISYALVPTACKAGNASMIHLVHLLCLLLALGAGLIAWKSWNTFGTEWSGTEGGPIARSRFMAGSGLVGSALFALVIVAQWLPSFGLSPCQ